MTDAKPRPDASQRTSEPRAPRVGEVVSYRCGVWKCETCGGELGASLGQSLTISLPLGCTNERLCARQAIDLLVAPGNPNSPQKSPHSIEPEA